MGLRLVYVDVGYACFGLVLDDADRIVDAAPIARWAIGKGAQHAWDFWHRKGQLRTWKVIA